jgi:hypothetical protein
MITIAMYYMDRHLKYGGELTPEKQLKAGTTVQRINQLIARMRADGIEMQINPNSKSPVSSGWRPAAINGSTPGAAAKSKHMTCEACDLYDPDGEIDEWALANPESLADLGLWQEHPSATKGWAHFQTVPPRSGNRVFYP